MSKQNLISKTIKSIEDKEFGIYFYTTDTKGNTLAGIANIYEHVRVLNDLGYKATILHDKNTYTPVKWLGEGYTDLPHMSIESGGLKISPQDFIIIPEVYSTVMEQLSKLPGTKIVMSQSYDLILELLPPGKSWADFGIKRCITTSESQAQYINKLFSSKIECDVIPISIPDYFKPTEKDKQPVVSVVCREQMDLVKIFKTFYLKHPHLKWVTFRDMRNMPREVFANELSKSCVSVWVDDIAGFGTFPLESMKSNVPVIGKVPNMVPEYFTDKNGVWTYSLDSIPDLIANYVQTWLEDNEPQEMFEHMEKQKDTYSVIDMEKRTKEVYESIFISRINELNEELNNLPKEVEELKEDK